MKDMIIERAMALKVGESVVIEMDSKEACRSIQVMVSNFMKHIDSKVKRDLMVRRCAPGEGVYHCDRWQLVVTKIDFFSAAKIVFADGSVENLVEYDYKVKSGNLR